jgi:hypothetical protein
VVRRISKYEQKEQLCAAIPRKLNNEKRISEPDRVGPQLFVSIRILSCRSTVPAMGSDEGTRDTGGMMPSPV